jgi:hypothetical protein
MGSVVPLAAPFGCQPFGRPATLRRPGTAADAYPVETAEDLIFRLTGRQKRNQRIWAGVLAGSTVVLAVFGILEDRLVLGWVLLMAAVITLLGSYLCFSNTRGFTECTAGGLRARTQFGRLVTCQWREVTDVRVDVSYGRGTVSRLVQVTLGGQRRVKLAVPNSTISGDADFAASARQIIGYWQTVAAAGAPDRPA